ncbi:unnamed protein product [Sphenostylis stenocarpa]|uniref:Uncharacterized protein n=1 Tax=Sphenostylis stenocarpa TaxID=92480 RepID=A0AA86SDR1_9FABA|nr:unnamed protein product [Sphenostylis stenocarpa]
MDVHDYNKTSTPLTQADSSNKAEYPNMRFTQTLTLTIFSIPSPTPQSSTSSMRSSFRSLTLSLSHHFPRPFLFPPRTRQFPRLAMTAPEREALQSAEVESRRLRGPEVEVGELSEVPEEWRRARVAWLCKQLPAHKAGMLVKILNGQKKWMTQEDATYILVHCLRIRENETAFKVSLPLLTSLS